MAATDGLPLAHVPPPASLNVSFDPIQTVVTPEMPNGSGFTIAVSCMVQPFAPVKVIVVVPCPIPVIKPVDEPMVAILLFSLVQTPPLDVSLTVNVLATHTGAIPVIGPGRGSTSIANVVIQLVGRK